MSGKLKLSSLLDSRPPVPASQVEKLDAQSPISPTVLPPEALDDQASMLPNTQPPEHPAAWPTGSPNAQATILPATQKPRKPRSQAPKNLATQPPGDPTAQQPTLPPGRLPISQAAQTPNTPGWADNKQQDEDDDDVLGLNVAPLAPDAWTAKAEAQSSRPEVWADGSLGAQRLSYNTLREQSFKSRKERTKKNIRLPSYKVGKYELWCFVNKMNFQDAVEVAMDYLTGLPDAHVLINKSIDNLDEKSSSVLRFYEKWTGNRPTVKDRESVLEIFDIPIGIIHCGIMLSVLRKAATGDGGRINSLRYCFGAIQETQKQGVQSPDEYLKYLFREAGRMGVGGK